MRAGWVVLCMLLLAATTALPSSGDLVCAQCHRAETARARESPMARALVPATQCNILRAHPELNFTEGIYRSSIRWEGDRSILSVTDGRQTLTVPLLWAFGNGKAGQTYVFEHDGALYESRVSFYSALNGLDLTMGARGTAPRTIEVAAGRRMDAIGARECFGCHSTGAVAHRALQLESLVPGVGCESCHGPGEKHAAAVRAGDAAHAGLPKLGALDAEEMNELCGRCHRTWQQIALQGPLGVNNVRFQPYRLTNSKCYDPADVRIRCTACHDPHGPLETNPAAYDRKCAACHSSGAQGKTCAVAKAGCVSCHMPKVELPGAHARFTDHQIRIARAGEQYPN